MNPIYDAWAATFPGLDMTKEQAKRADRKARKADVAAVLPKHAAYIRERMESIVGKGVIEDQDVAARVPLSFYTSSIAAMSDEWFFAQMKPMRALELGQASSGNLRDLYRRHIGEYHQQGAEWWEAVFVAAAKRDGTFKQQRP